jgi:hypothetical protein
MLDLFFAAPAQNQPHLKSALHFRETLSVAAELHPRLGTLAEDLHIRLHPARVVERPGHNHRDVRHDLGIIDKRRSAFGAEAPEGCFAAVTATGERLQRALHIQCRRWQRYDDGSATTMAKAVPVPFWQFLQ